MHVDLIKFSDRFQQAVGVELSLRYYLDLMKNVNTFVILIEIQGVKNIFCLRINYNMIPHVLIF